MSFSEKMILCPECGSSNVKIIETDLKVHKNEVNVGGITAANHELTFEYIINCMKCGRFKTNPYISESKLLMNKKELMAEEL